MDRYKPSYDLVPALAGEVIAAAAVAFTDFDGIRRRIVGARGELR
jgi:hypothetical protein